MVFVLRFDVWDLTFPCIPWFVFSREIKSNNHRTHGKEPKEKQLRAIAYEKERKKDKAKVQDHVQGQDRLPTKDTEKRFEKED